MPLRALALIGFIVASIPVCFFRPFYGVVLWIVVAFLNPQSYTWTALGAFPWATAVALPTMSGMLIFERRFGRLMTREVGLLLLLWIWFTLTTLFSINAPEFVHHADDTIEKWWFVSKILLMTFCLIPVVSSFERLRRLMLTIAGCFGFYVVKAIPFLIATGGVYRLYGPERSMIGDNTDFGLAMTMTLPLFFYLAQTEGARWLKNLSAIVFVMTIPVIFFTYSRGALIGLTAVFAVMVLRSRKRFALIPVAALGIVLALYFAPESWRERMDPTREDAVDGSAQIRLQVWAFARALANDYPITGGGFGTFTEELYTRYWPGRLGGTIFGPHSVYFQVLGEHGYVGLTLYLSVVFFTFVTTRRLRKRARSRGDKQIALYAQMLEMSLVGFLVSGIFLGRAYFDYYFTIIACVACLNRIAAERWAVTVPAPQTASNAVGVGYAPPLALPQPQLSTFVRK
jgi:probable O-glycosylation ligase (exosortase A-associated)